MQSRFGQDETQQTLINVLIGFFGVLGAFLLLPRTVKFMIRRFFLGIISEVVTIVLTGLLTEKLVDVLSRDHEDAADLPERERSFY